MPPQKNLLKAGCGVVGDFQLVFTCFQPGFDSIEIISTIFQPRICQKPLELGPTKARNVFCTLKIGGWHVGTPRDPHFVPWKPSCGVLREARPFVHMAPTPAHQLKIPDHPTSGL